MRNHVKPYLYVNGNLNCNFNGQKGEKLTKSRKNIMIFESTDILKTEPPVLFKPIIINFTVVFIGPPLSLMAKFL